MDLNYEMTDRDQDHRDFSWMKHSAWKLVETRTCSGGFTILEEYWYRTATTIKSSSSALFETAKGSCVYYDALFHLALVRLRISGI